MLCEHDLLCLPINSLRWQLVERQCQGHNIRMYLCVNWRRIRKFTFCILYLHDSTGLCPPFCRKSLWLHIYMQYVVHLWIRDELDCPLIKLLISMESYHLNESQCTRAFLAIPPSFHSLALSSLFFRGMPSSTLLVHLWRWCPWQLESWIMMIYSITGKVKRRLLSH